jgi:hypothetical protein
VDGRYVVEILLSAALAASRPAYDDWLNDLSWMPPVSVTMHALYTDVDAAGVELAGLAHPATIKASALNAAAVLAIPLTNPPNSRRI